MADYSYIGKGSVFAKRAGVAEAKRNLVNVHGLSVSIATAKRSLADFESISGGQANSSSRIDTVTGTLDLRNITAENLAMSGLGTVSAVAAGAVVDEAHTAYKGGLLRTAKHIDLTQTVTVTGTGGTPTYVAGTDYSVRAAGVVIAEASTIADGTAVEISYTAKAGKRVQFLVESSVEYELTFAGLNEAQSGAPVTVDVWRFKAEPFQSFDLMSDDYATLSISGEFLSDSTKGTGESAFFRAEMDA